MSDMDNCESFEARMKDIVTHGYILSGVSIGAKLELFKAMSQMKQPFIVTELASKTQCKQRYIKEWLHHMVVADIVDADESGTQYTLPESRVNALTSPDQPVMSMAGPFPYMLQPHCELMECFKEDGPNGLPFTAVKKYLDECHLLPAERNDIVAAADFIRDNIPGLKESLETGIVALDVGSGYGEMLCHVAAQFPNSRFVGFDYSVEQIQTATELAKTANLTNIEFYQQDACNVSEEWASSFDIAWMRDTLHDMPFASKCLKDVYTSLKPGGQLALFEFSCSSNPFINRKEPSYQSLCKTLYPGSLYHCLTSSMVTPGSEALGACAGHEVYSTLLENAGFTTEKMQQLPNTVKCVFVCRKNVGK